MSQGTLNWPPLQQSDTLVGFATDEHLKFWVQDPNAIPQPAFPQDIPLPQYTSYLIDSGEYLNDMTLADDYLLSPTDIKSNDITNHIYGNAHAQLDYGHGLFSLDIPSYYEPMGPPTCSTFTDSSPQSPVEPCVAGNLLNQEFPSIKLPDITDQILPPFDGDQDPQSDDVLPADVAALLFASRNINDPSTQSWPPVIQVDDVEDHLVKSVGSTQIQQAASKRRNKDGIHQCPFRNSHTAKCEATFSMRHNLRYHIYAHLGLKPYECGKCKYAASSPATLKRHMSTCIITSSKGVK